MLKTDEIITLRIDDFMESSSIVTALGRQSGVVKLLAKGAKRVKSPLRMAFQLYSLSQVVFYFKIERELNILKEGKISEIFDVFTDLEKFNLVSNVASFFLKRTPLGGGQSFFELLLDLFRKVSTLKRVNPNLYYFFALKFLESQGEIAIPRVCQRCQEREIRYFVPASRQFLCEPCAESENHKINVDRGIWNELQSIIEKDWEFLNTLAVRENTLEIIKAFLQEP